MVRCELYSVRQGRDLVHVPPSRQAHLQRRVTPTTVRSTPPRRKARRGHGRNGCPLEGVLEERKRANTRSGHSHGVVVQKQGTAVRRRQILGPDTGAGMHQDKAASYALF